MLKEMNKIGISELVSYIMLISMVLVISIGVYAWIKTYANANPVVDCKDETSLIIEDIKCSRAGSNKIVQITFKNNGRFNVDGVIATVSNISEKDPFSVLRPQSGNDNYYFFASGLKPDQSTIIAFTAVESLGLSIAKIEIQPLIIDKKTMVVCKNAIRKQNVDSCNF